MYSQRNTNGATAVGSASRFWQWRLFWKGHGIWKTCKVLQVCSILSTASIPKLFCPAYRRKTN